MSAELVPAPELARRLSVSRRTITRLQDRGMPVVRVSTRCVRYDPAAVRAWLASQQAPRPLRRGRPRRVVGY